MSHTPEPYPAFDPYVTGKGGVVIFNGPFPQDKANRIADLCRAAPDLADVARMVIDSADFCDMPDKLVKAATEALRKAGEI